MNPETTQNAGGKSLRLLRPSIVVLCGPSACGKSTFAQRHFRPTQIISSDCARALVCDDERDQLFNTQAFALVHFLVEQRLTLNRLCVVDSTALTTQARKDLLNLAKKCQVPTALILFDVPLVTCVERDAKRERSVGQSIVERQFQSFEASRDAIRHEGFDQVIEFHGDDAEKVQIEILFRPVQRPQRVDAGPSRRFDRPSQPFVRRHGGNGTRVPPPANAPGTPSAQTPEERRPIAPPSALAQTPAERQIITPANPAAASPAATTQQLRPVTTPSPAAPTKVATNQPAEVALPRAGAEQPKGI